jgi:hypothetical protein
MISRVFDTPLRLQHPKEVLTFGTRLFVVVLALAVATMNGAICAGWSASPEARMACCADDACPMHKSESKPSSETHHDVTQAQADSCCAAAERDDASQSPPSFVSAVTFAVVPSPVGFALPGAASSSHGSYTLVPIPRTHVATHLLLSVLIV